MKKNVLKTYIESGIQALERMERTSLKGKAVSLETLNRIVRKNEDTEYGRKYGFREIRSYEEYREKVPFSVYEDYEPYIDRMLLFGHKNLITADEVVYYAHTSGTSGAYKMIPCTQEALQILFNTIFERAFGLHEITSRSRTGKGMPSFRGVNLMESKVVYTQYGAGHGAISETLNVPADTPYYNALPEEIIYPISEFDRRYVKMLFALRERRLSFLMATFSPTVYDMIMYLKHNWRLLCDDLEAGRINPDIPMDPLLRKKLDRKLAPDPVRAAEIRGIMAEHESGAFVPLLWPDLKLIATVGTGTFAPHIERLRQPLGPDIMVDHLGYVCSEATVAAALHAGEPAYMLLPFSGFYEFLPVEEGAEETPLTMDQLEAGKEYELIITNLSGFYRYRLGDVIRVTGYHHECPKIVFSYRKNQLISMYGEKVTETVLLHAIEEMAEESGTAVHDYSVYPDTGTEPGHYIVLMESDREITPEKWPFYSEILNRKLCAAHPSYRQKITQKTMLPLEVRFVQPQTYALYRDLKALSGASPNQIKPVHVIKDERLKRFFFGLLQK